MEENTRHETSGLTGAEVRERIGDGRVNAYVQKASRTYSEIIRSNVLTRFNAVLGGLFLVVIILGSINDALFGMVLILNSLIGIIQEIRAKKTLDALSLISAPKAKVIRDGSQTEIPYGQVVVDDLLVLHPGDQVVVDGTVVSSEGLEIDESMLTWGVSAGKQGNWRGAALRKPHSCWNWKICGGQGRKRGICTGTC